MSTGLALFTAFHTILSILALLSGVLVIRGLITRNPSDKWTKFFLTTAIATSITGFFFPFHGMTPAIGVGVIALIVLVVSLATWRSRERAGFGSATFIVSLVFSEYFLAFVGVAQAFTKISFLHALAPTLKEPPFGVAQAVVFFIFVALAIVGLRHRTKA